MKINFNLIGLILIIALSSCTKEYVVPNEVLPTNVSFSTAIQPIFTTNCISCHGGTVSPNLTDGQAYSNLISGNLVIANDAANSTLYQRLTGANGSSIMPPSGKLSSNDLDKVLVWINEGAKNN